MPDGNPATEQVYIHSKMMIVDDDVMLVGSANINDRSMLGSRDSEIAAIVEDVTKIESRFDGERVEVSNLVRQARIQCFERIFGIVEDKLHDPMSAELWAEIDRNTAVSNHLIIGQ